MQYTISINKKLSTKYLLGEPEIKDMVQIVLM